MRQYSIQGEIQLRPRADSNYIARSRTALITGRDGFIDPDSEQGLFVHKTRLLSAYRYLLGGRPPLEAGTSNVEASSSVAYYVIQAPNSDHRDRISGPGGSVTQDAVELRLNRSVGEGLRERATLTNYTQKEVSLSLDLIFDADFADPSELGAERKQRGRLERTPAHLEGDTWETRFDYQAENQGPDGTLAQIHRQVIIRVQVTGSHSAPKDRGLSLEGKGLRFMVQLPPQQEWVAEVTVAAVIEGDALPLPGLPSNRSAIFQGPVSSSLAASEPERADDEYDRRRNSFLAARTSFSYSQKADLSHIVLPALEQAAHDLAALRFYDLDQADDGGWTLAAGLPVYSELFGRDTLTASWQAAMLGPEMMRGTLQELKRWQGQREDDWRDEQPGKMPHQVSIAPVARLGFNPFDRYYGSITTSGFYPFVVSQLWHWTGNKETIQPFIDSALAGLQYLDRYGDLDGDGFYEYQSRSPEGLKNQAWKDSDDAIVYEDGSQVPAPIATCEEQAFVYVAKFHLSEVLWRLGRRDEARKLYHEASELKKRFNEAFWMEEEGFVAMALDPDKRQVRSIGSNAGHCIAAGILDESMVERVTDVMMGPELFTGWGVRTLSSRHPAFNPYSYHRGSVWPVEQGTFALGFWRYGLHQQTSRLGRAQFEAAALYPFYRLPELFAGHARDVEHPFPALYPKACWPQAWSSSALFCFVQAMIGLYPYAPLNILIVDPHLPIWLPEITLEGLRVGASAVSLRFYREEDGESDFEILERRGTLRVIRQPSPWSITSGPIERVVDLFQSLVTSL